MLIIPVCQHGFFQVSYPAWNFQVVNYFLEMRNCISSVIKQNSEFQNGGNEKTKYAEFSDKWKFLTPWNAHVR